MSIKLTDKQVDAARRAAIAIGSAFDWGESPEGVEFWAWVASRLRASAENKTTDGQPQRFREPTREDIPPDGYLDVEVCNADWREDAMRFKRKLVVIYPSFLYPDGKRFGCVFQTSESGEETNEICRWPFARIPDVTPESIPASDISIERWRGQVADRFTTKGYAEWRVDMLHRQASTSHKP